MRLVLVHNWWSLVIRGSAAILFGLLSIAWPGVTVGALVLLFGVYALIDGIVALAGIRKASAEHQRWGALVVEGIVGILAALATFAWPAITAVVLIYMIAAWALITGVLEIAAAIQLRQHVSGELLLALAGLASIAFGVLLMIFPLTGALLLAVWLGVYCLFFGVTLILLGLRLRSHHRRFHLEASTVAAP
jgi:uncharacterized membrane protein HdeD (DUF308 family)